MVISLYSVRIVFDALGIEDYGIQNVVSSFVSMFSFVTGSLSVSISRFMTIEVEQNNRQNLNSVYSTSIQIMLFVSLLFLVSIETFGVWFLNSEMNIAEERMNAANWVLQFAAFTLVVSLISVPFDALIISHEKMSAFAYIGILGNIIKLLIAFLIYYSPIDALVYYSLLLLIQSVIIRISYKIYCSRKFPEVKMIYSLDRVLMKKILSLAGWDLWGSSSYILKNYGVNIILNMFFGPIVNAARGIALQVNTAVTQFSGGFLTALRPQIIKTYVSGEKSSLWNLVDSGTKFATFLLLAISLPIMFECHYILSIWLGEVPSYTENFVILTIILSLSEGTLIYTQNTALMANGNIRESQLITGIIQLLNIPIVYVLFKRNFPPESSVILAIIIAHICCFVRNIFLSKYTGYSVGHFFISVYLRIIAVGIVMALPIFCIKNMMSESLFRLLFVICVSLIWSIVVIITLGCNQKERYFIIQKIRSIYCRI